jgi:uncharacterized protein (TIGR02147 family)
MTKKTHFLNLREYTNPILYLKDLFLFEKEQRSDFSLEIVAESVGISRSLLSMVLSEKRKLTLEQIHAFARFLKLNRTDHEFWEALVHFHQSEFPQDKNWYSEKIKNSNESSETFQLRSAASQLVSKWYIPVLFVYLLDFENSEIPFDEIALHFRIEVSELKFAIESLEREGFLQYKNKGSVHISFDKIAGSISQKRYLVDILTEAAHRMKAHFENPSHFFTSHTFTIDSGNFASFVLDFKALMNKYIAKKYASTATDQVVYQSAFQLFPVLSK